MNRVFIVALLIMQVLMGTAVAGEFLPGARVLLDAHNCYPYMDFWADRVERALATGFPIAIEQDIDWVPDAENAGHKSIVSHGSPYTHNEPTIEVYFFDKVRPYMEHALAEGDQGDWPLVTLNLDFKNGSREHVQHIYDLLKKHEAWLCTAAKSANPAEVTPIIVRPMLVLLPGGGNLHDVFYDQLEVGENILAFGAASTNRVGDSSTASPEEILTHPADNFRRWWNNSWNPIEAGGAFSAGEFTPESATRIKAFVEHAHKLGYWIRFYSLNGDPEGGKNGQSPTYNFRTLERVTQRWRACFDAGVDFIASDQYEDLQRLLVEWRK